MKSKFDWIRRSQRVIRMVSELHRMGYQGLRIMPYLHPNAWRLAIAPYELFSQCHGAVIPFDKGLGEAAIYSAASGSSYFDWADAKNDDARTLAEKFVIRFPELAQRGRERDWSYAGWLCELMGFLEGGDWLPVMYWEHMKGRPESLNFLPVWSVTGNNLAWEENEAIPGPSTRRFPLPPVRSLGQALASPIGLASEELTLLHLGAEGGDLRLVLHMTAKGIYSFRVDSRSCESAMFDDEDFADMPDVTFNAFDERPLVIDWLGALKMLDENRRAWPLFCPLYIHPSISEHILHALKERYSQFPQIDFSAWESCS